MTSKVRNLSSILASVILGAAAIVTPAFEYSVREDEKGAFGGLVYRAVEGFQPMIVVPLLILAGYLSSRIARIHPLVIGACSIAVLPMWSVLDIVLGDPSTERHNLLPIEWLFYLVLGLAASGGAALERRRKVRTDTAAASK